MQLPCLKILYGFFVTSKIVEGIPLRISPPSTIRSTLFSNSFIISAILFIGFIPLLFTLVETIGTSIKSKSFNKKASFGTRRAAVPLFFVLTISVRASASLFLFQKASRALSSLSDEIVWSVSLFFISCIKGLSASRPLISLILFSPIGVAQTNP